MKSIKICKVTAFFIVLIITQLLVFGNPLWQKTCFAQNSTAKSYSYTTAKRNVTLFCSKAYFNKVYADVKTEIIKSPFSFDFYVSQNPSDFFVAGFENNKLVFYYTNSKQFSGYNNIKIGTDFQKLKQSKLKFIEKYEIIRGSIIHTFTDPNLKKEYDVVLSDERYYVFFFYDNLSSLKTVNGIFMVKKELWDDFLINDNVFKTKKDINSIISGFERLAFLHLNSIRSLAKNSLFKYSAKISAVARLHSQNMAKYNFFGHSDIFGQSPADRFEKEGIAFKRMGENIAMGTKMLPFFANHLLLNSKGHRKNIEQSFEYVGIGCAIELSSENVYYTQNFATL